MSDAITGSVTSTSGGIAATHPPVEVPPVHVAPTGEEDTNTIRTPFMAIACWKMEDLRFEFGSSFIKPGAAEEFAELAALVKEHPEAPLSIFGHADPVGMDEPNKVLSGRRAASVYGMLTRRTEIWEDIYNQGGEYAAPYEKDKWGTKVVQRILEDLEYSPGPINGELGDETHDAVKRFQIDQGLKVDGKPGKQTREKLFLTYMDKHCWDEKGDPFKLDPGAFLAQGKDGYGKGDYQGCGEFNPQMLFSGEEQKKYQKDENKVERDRVNVVNRRVLVLLFRSGNHVKPHEWPCPRAKEGPSGCKKRFWSDGEDRRSRRLPDERRKYEETEDTFACRFYQRLLKASPCEHPIPLKEGLAYLAVIVFFHARPMEGLHVRFSELKNGGVGRQLGKPVFTDKNGVAVFSWAVPVGNYVCEVEYQKPKVICTVFDLKRPEILVLPIGSPYLCIDGDIEFRTD